MLRGLLLSQGVPTKEGKTKRRSGTTGVDPSTTNARRSYELYKRLSIALSGVSFSEISPVMPPRGTTKTTKWKLKKKCKRGEKKERDTDACQSIWLWVYTPQLSWRDNEWPSNKGWQLKLDMGGDTFSFIIPGARSWRARLIKVADRIPRLMNFGRLERLL